jgi:hypothetical protein
LLIIFLFAPSFTPSDTIKTTGNITETELIVEPMKLTVDDLKEAVDENAFRAATTYKDRYVKLTGKLSSIDTDGKYFFLEPLSSRDFIMTGNIHCKIENIHRNTIMNFTVEQEVTVIGTMTSVGEVAGYTVQVDSIE